MSESEARVSRVLAIDAGGTMTDTFIVDEHGSFVVGKAQTTPENESIGFMASARDALGQWGSSPEEGFPTIVSGIYSGTAMLNRLLQRQGLKVGCIVNAGHEDYLRLERGIQTYIGSSYSDRLHLATHFHNEPLVPRALMKGVRGRIDVFGDEVLPLREEDVREAAAELLEEGVQGIVVSLLFSYRNASHEKRVGEIVAEEKARRSVNGSVPVFLSSELYPMRRDLPRLNSTLIEAYAAEPSRATLKEVREVTKSEGARFELRVMSAHGGTVSIETKELGRTLVSGPIGGVVGGQALARRMGLENVLCTDIGGTSFDIALITDGRFEITQTPDVARFLLNMPLVRVDSIGAGTGSFVRVNPNSNRPELGPDSAGSRIGVSWPEGGLDTVSVTDLNLVLGRLNPDYFLGGEVAARRRGRGRGDRAPDRVAARAVRARGGRRGDRAVRADAQERGGRADPRQGLLAGRLRAALLRRRRASARGRLHGRHQLPRGARARVGGRLLGLRLRVRRLRLPLRPDRRPAALPAFGAAERAAIGTMITGAWLALQDRVAAEFSKSAIDRERIRFTHAVRMQYYGQLNDIEFVSPHPALEGAAEVEDLIAAFEDAYAKMYASSARSPEFGYLVTHVIVHGTVDVEKPALPQMSEEPGTPPLKARRPVHWGRASEGEFVETDIFQLEEIRAGNTIEGPAIVEHSATTFAIPPGRRAELDAHHIFHLHNAQEV